jgi:glycosyltransferase involved in cell wall biosynthesis
MEKTKNNPLVTIIAMCYNHNRFLKETLDSIDNQTYENIELIITDDGSTDNSVVNIENWVEKHNNRYNINYIFNRNNKGVCHTANLALLKANGEYVQFVSCDDILNVNKINEQVLKLEEANINGLKYAFCYSDVEMIDEKTKVIKKSFYDYYNIEHRQFEFADILKRNTIPWVSVMFSRGAMKQIGLFDETLYCVFLS